jgi:hypothetical protein
LPATSLKGYEIQTTGSNSGTWGQVLNDNMIQYVDDNLAGITTLSLSSSNVTLSASQARMCMLRLSGTLLANVVITSANNGIYLVENVTAGSFTVTLSDGSLTVTIPQSRRAVVYRDATNGPRIVSAGGTGANAADPIPVGTVMLFYQNAAPTGWTISAALNDYALKIVSSAGGVTSGSVAYSTLFGRTATDSHTLTVAQIPSHTHSQSETNSSSGGIEAGNDFTSNGSATTGATGGGGGHTHNIDMRVRTLAFVLAQKV